MSKEPGLTSQSHSSSPPRLLMMVTPVLLLFLLLTFAHLKTWNLPPGEATGLLPVLDRLFDLSFALLLGAITFCVGRCVFRYLRLEFDHIAEEISFSVMLGSGVIGMGVLLLGLVGLLSLFPVILLLLLLLWFSRNEVPRLFSASRELILAACRTRWRILLSLLFLLVTVNLLIRAATPVHSFDEAIYHLSVAKRFATENRVYPVTDNWAGNGPFLIQMVYVICILAKADIAAKLFSLLLALVSSLSLYGFCRRFLSHQTGLIALFVFFGAGMVVEVSVTARTDVSLAFVLFLATYGMMAYLESEKPEWLYASAILAGIAMGVKYTAGIWILLLAVLYLVESGMRKTADMQSILKRGLIYTAIVLAIASPWFLKNAIWFHNPVYPFVTGEVAEIDANNLRFFNSLDDARMEQFYQIAKSADLGLAEFRKHELESSAANRVARNPLKVWEYFTKPDLYNMAEDNHYPNYLFVLSPLVLLFYRRRWLLWLALLSAGFFIAVTTTSWVGRLLLPVYPALTMICSFILSQSIEVWKNSHWQKVIQPVARILVCGVVGVAVGFTAYQSYIQARKEKALEFVSGAIPRRQFMLSQFYYPPLDFMNTHLPAEARVMMVGAQMSYDLERPYLAEVNWDSTDWRRLLIRNRNFAELSEDLKRQGITHILFTDSLFKWVALMGRANYPNVSGARPQSGPDYYTQLRNWTTFDIYSRDYLEQIYTDQMGFIIYRVK